jgi:hypothetical protein
MANLQYLRLRNILKLGIKLYFYSFAISYKKIRLWRKYNIYTIAFLRPSTSIRSANSSFFKFIDGVSIVQS